MLAVESFESQLQRFHRGVLAGQTGWESGWADDQLVLSVGRTWRLGPEPEYMTVWHTPSAGLERLDAWDKTFRSGEADEIEKPFSEVARIERAGCYEPLLEPIRQSAEKGAEAWSGTRGGIYYAEFFEPLGSHDKIRKLYAKRAASHPKLTLALCIVRIGKLAPDPGALAIWSLPEYAALAAIARDLDGTTEPVRLTAAGVYNDVGREIL
jgi:hypothetical protein